MMKPETPIFDADDPRNPDNNPNVDWIIMWPIIIGSVIGLIGAILSEAIR